jgi:hypothetical protein
MGDKEEISMMRHMTVCLLLLSVAVLGGLRASAEPITYDSDSRVVTLDIARWVMIHFEDSDEFYLDVEATETLGTDLKKFRANYNCNAHISGAFMPPPGSPGTWSWNFTLGGGQGYNVAGPGEDVRHVRVKVENISINEPAGHYEGGLMEIFIDAL